MKTYRIIYAVFALVVFGCSKTDETTITEEESFFKADYVLLQSHNGNLSAQLLNASNSSIKLNPAESTFLSTALPSIAVEKGSRFGYYQKITECSGEVILHDFKDDSSKTLNIFPDLVECELEVTSIEVHANMLYVSYVAKETSKINKYYVRVLNMDAPDPFMNDVELAKKPLQMAVANGRLFILTVDLEITDENALSVMDVGTNGLIREIGLGYDAEQLFARTDQNIIISYPELHTVLNSETMAVSYVGYEDGKEPKFYGSRFNCFDSQGRYYYEMPTEDGIYPQIPAIYDFSNNLAILYYYENFLTSAQLEFEFKIGDTTMVSYDNTNSVMLVGYKKMDNEDKGGLLRIKLEPAPEFLDNIDLDGVPRHIFYQ